MNSKLSTEKHPWGLEPLAPWRGPSLSNLTDKLQEENNELKEELKELRFHRLLRGYSTKFIQRENSRTVDIHIYCDGTLAGIVRDLSAVQTFIEWHSAEAVFQYEKKIVEKVREELHNPTFT
jgi:hypothetical protein